MEHQHPKFLAIDIGAESGRGILGTLDNNKLLLKEVSRFPNGMLTIHGHYHWNIFRLYQAIKDSLKTCTTETHFKPESIGIDTWGVDYALLAEDETILSIPYAYRDPRTDNMMEEVFKLIPRKRIYELTGIQFMQFNTIFQLYAMKKANSPLLDIASDLLFIPDIIHYLLTGIKRSEFTFATTSQLYNPNKNDWEKELFDAIGINKDIMCEIIQPGEVIGELTGMVGKETGLPGLPVTSIASHDTGSAVVGVPGEGENFAYISSGTWSLMGVENKKPNNSEKAFKYNFTNEGGVDGTYRFLKNIMGLWLLQECKRSWEKQGNNYSYGELVEMAEEVPSFKIMIDPDCPDFINPTDMPEAIINYCKKTNQQAPGNPAEFTRCICDSLAFKYRMVFDQLKEVTGRPLDRINIIGGGTKNKLLCQLTANATGVPVVTGPEEATAIGNIMVQAMAMGYVSSLSEIRAVIRNSFDLKTYEPKDIEQWDRQYQRFFEIINS